MTQPIAVAAYTSTYPSRTPYITAAEYINAPSAVNASNLVQGGNQQQNQQQLNSVIARASAVADQIVFGEYGSLAATTDIDGPKRLRIDRYGVVEFATRFHPILQINQILIGPSTSTLVSMTAQQATNISINQNGVIEIPTPWNGPIGTTQILYGGWAIGSTPLVQVTYVNGYPNTTLADTVAAGVSEIQVANPLGIYPPTDTTPGTSLTLYDDGQGNEAIQVADGYSIGDTTVPLVTPLLYNHSAGVSISNLPPTVKQATISLTSALIKTRGSLAIVMNQVRSTPSPVQQQDGGALNDYQYAVDLLSPFKRVR